MTTPPHMEYYFRFELTILVHHGGCYRSVRIRPECPPPPVGEDEEILLPSTDAEERTLPNCHSSIRRGAQRALCFGR